MFDLHSKETRQRHTLWTAPRPQTPPIPSLHLASALYTIHSASATAARRAIASALQQLRVKIAPRHHPPIPRCWTSGKKCTSANARPIGREREREVHTESETTFGPISRVVQYIIRGQQNVNQFFRWVEFVNANSESGTPCSAANVASRTKEFIYRPSVGDQYRLYIIYARIRRVQT